MAAIGKRKSDLRPLLLGAGLFLLLYGIVMAALGRNPFAHSSYDSYTLIANAWRRGTTHLDGDYPWLELAIFNGEYHVSFPSVPAVVMWGLSFAFGENTPSNLVVLLYLFGAYFAGYALARRTQGEWASACVALTLTAGCSLFACIEEGGVWYQAQLLAFLLTLLAFHGLTGKNALQRAGGLLCIALSVGCRPFHAVYVPVCLWLLCEKVGLKRMIPYLIAPALVALALGWYNWVRFGNPLEFGHNYLPEFTRDPSQPQFSLQYVAENLKNVLRLPAFEGGWLTFPRFNGSNFFICCPLYVLGAFALCKSCFMRDFDAVDALLLGGILLEMFLTLMHKTLGGWAFGNRYFCDMLPAVCFLCVRKKRLPPLPVAAAVAAFAVALNFYGTLWFYLSN